MNEDCLITKACISGFIKKRDKDSHKGNYGKVLIYAESRSMAGAAVLCARAALRSGAGLVRVSVPEELFQSFRSACRKRPASQENRSLKT